MKKSRLKFITAPAVPTKYKMMLWIERDMVKKLEELEKPEGMSVQECIRQILRNHLLNNP